MMLVRKTARPMERRTLTRVREGLVHGDAILWHSTLSAFHYYGLTGYMYAELPT